MDNYHPRILVRNRFVSTDYPVGGPVAVLLVGRSAVATPQAAAAGELGVDGGVFGVLTALVVLALGRAVVQTLEEVLVVTAVYPVP